MNPTLRNAIALAAAGLLLSACGGGSNSTPESAPSTAASPPITRPATESAPPSAPPSDPATSAAPATTAPTEPAPTKVGNPDSSPTSSGVPLPTKPANPPSTGQPDMPPADGVVTPATVRLVSRSNSAATVTQKPSPLGSPAEVSKFLGEYDADFAADIRGAINQVSAAHPGADVWGAAVDVSCVAPRSIAVSRSANGLSVVADKAPQKNVQCLVPTSTVAIFAVD